MGVPALRMVAVSKRFPGVQALTKVSIDVNAGETLALMGANGAGKSTLMNILGGVIVPDEGDIEVGGITVRMLNPRDADQNCIAFIHQEMALLPSMTVAENIFIKKFPRKLGLIRRSQIEEAAKTTLLRLGCSVRPQAKVRELSPGDRQMVEIARALLSDARIIIFDEPTSSLAEREKERLFHVIKALQAQGKALIYITHFMDEVFKVCDRAIVLRNGEVVGSGALADLSRARIVELMIGTAREAAVSGGRSEEIHEPVLRTDGFGRRGVLQDISFTLHGGEILGLWGLLGSGRTELARAIVGLDPIDSGHLYLRVGEGLRPIRPSRAQKWIGLLTESRRDDGLLLPSSVRENLSIASLSVFAQKFWPMIDRKKEEQAALQIVERLAVKTGGIEQAVQTLSGGNQQKVVVGKWLLRHPLVYIMDEPSKGLDVGAKAEIRRIIYELAASGAGVILITSEIEEMIELASRFLVIHRGRIVAEKPHGTSKEDLMASASEGR